MFTPIVLTNYDRPDRTATKTRDLAYHLQYGRYAVGSGFNSKHSDWQSMCWIIRQFWLGNQWIMREDLEAFLKDESMQSTNRIKTIKNFIKPIVEQYRGNATILDITPGAECTSSKAINRREEKLQEMLFYTKVAQQAGPQFKQTLKSKLPIGDTEDETESMFNNLFVDGFTNSMNEYLRYVGKENKFKQKQPELALDIAMTGMAVKKYFVHNGDFKFKRVTPERFFWDRNAIEYDLTDSEFMGEYDYMLPTEIFERWNHLTPEEIKGIEDAARNSLNNSNANSGFCNGRVPVYTAYWKDYEQLEYGYVLDEYGYPYLTQINIKDNEESHIKKYKDKDLIPLKQLNETQKKILKGKNKAKLYCDLIRYVEFIPSEITGLSNTNDGGDIALDWGIMPYQDTEYTNWTNAQFPYKAFCWVYYDGVVDSPISALINPQRMINRTASVSQNIIDNMKSSNVFYDKTMIDQQSGGEAEFLKNLHQGKPIGMNARGNGMHNAIMEYEPKVGAALQFDSVIQSHKNSMESIIGVNDALRGESTGSGQLIGVTQLQIQRASLIQEPFYFALEQVELQCYQAAANVGRRVFMDNDRKVAIMVGDHNAKYLTLPDSTETFRVFVERTTSREQQIQLANNQLLAWKQLGMIDDEFYSKMYNRSDMFALESGFREYSRLKSEMMKQQAQQQQQQQQQLMGQVQQQDADAKKQAMMETLMGNDNKQQDRNTAIQKELIKSNTKRQQPQQGKINF